MDTQPNSNCCPKCQAPLPADAPQGLCPKCLLAAVATPTDAGQPAGRPTPPPLEQVAAAFPQLEILEFIGQGGMGFVFKARQPKLDRLVALKILPQSLAADPTFAERFNREARLLARLNHPGIVTVHDFGVATTTSHLTPDTPHFYYLLMEFVDGVNLRQAMQAGRFTSDQALAIVPKICEALQFAHNEGILHRDIKPENILLDAKGRVKIADFGIAKLVGADAAERSAELRFGASHSLDPNAPNRSSALHALTEAGKALGTPNYMAPEQRECSGEVDHRADIYSLGVVFYEMLTGELPLGRFAPPSQKSAADPRVDEVVLRALEKEKAKRYASAGEVKTQVETIAATSSGSSRPEEAQTERPRAESGKPGKCSWFVSWFVSPLSSSEVHEIAAHMTRAERSEFSFYGLLLGLWVVTATFGNLWLIRSFPAPGSWIVAAVITALFFASLPLMWRMQRRFLCSTAWAKEHGYEAASIKLFSLSRKNLWPMLIYIGLVILLVFGQSKLFPRLSGTAELTQSLKESAARTKEQMARLAAQKKAAAQNLSFGQVVERTLSVNGKECDFLVFRSGEVVRHSYVDGDSNDETPPTAFMKWVRENGVDVGFCVSTDKFYSPFGLLVLDMGTFRFSSETIPNADIPRFRSVADWQAYNATHRDSPAAHPLIGSLVGVTNVWDDLTADQLQRPTNDVPAIFLKEKLHGLWFSPTNTTGPIAFSTRDGIEGILQITGFTENPRGVKLRYKLVQNADAKAAGVSLTPPAADASQAAVSAAHDWLALIDAGSYSETWKEASAILQGTVTEPAWENSMTTFRQPLGALVSRQLKSAQPLAELPGAPDGHYVLMQFETSFANKKSAIETVTFLLDKDGRWKSAGYFIK